MTRTRSTPNLRACKAEAKRLLAALMSGDTRESHEAGERLRHIPPYADASVEELVRARDDVQLKHAQWAVAMEEGYPDWKALKDAADFFWYPRDSATLNAWFARYEEARACLDEKGGYLLTHHGKYFVCQAGYVAALGIDPRDPRWAVIGHDVARPKDPRACEELVKLAEAEAKKPRSASGRPGPRDLPRWMQRR